MSRSHSLEFTRTHAVRRSLSRTYYTYIQTHRPFGNEYNYFLDELSTPKSNEYTFCITLAVWVRVSGMLASACVCMWMFIIILDVKWRFRCQTHAHCFRIFIVFVYNVRNWSPSSGEQMELDFCRSLARLQFDTNFFLCSFIFVVVLCIYWISRCLFFFGGHQTGELVASGKVNAAHRPLSVVWRQK